MRASSLQTVAMSGGAPLRVGYPMLAGSCRLVTRQINTAAKKPNHVRQLGALGYQVTFEPAA